MTEKDLRAGYRGLAFSAIPIFLINFLIGWASPELGWDIALVQATKITFWSVLFVALAFEGFIRSVRRHHNKNNLRNH